MWCSENSRWNRFVKKVFWFMMRSSANNSKGIYAKRFFVPHGDEVADLICVIACLFDFQINRLGNLASSRPGLLLQKTSGQEIFSLDGKYFWRDKLEWAFCVSTNRIFFSSLYTKFIVGRILQLFYVYNFSHNEWLLNRYLLLKFLSVYF